jgi:hypothetical protein
LKRIIPLLYHAFVLFASSFIPLVHEIECLVVLNGFGEFDCLIEQVAGIGHSTVSWWGRMNVADGGWTLKRSGTPGDVYCFQGFPVHRGSG